MTFAASFSSQVLMKHKKVSREQKYVFFPLMIELDRPKKKKKSKHTKASKGAIS